MEVMNRFKRLDLVYRVPEGLWTEVHNIAQEVVTKTIFSLVATKGKKKCKKAKRLSEESLQIAEKRRVVKGKGKKGKIYPSECRDPKNGKER